MIALKYNIKSAFTLVELMVTVLAVSVLVIGVSGMLAQGHIGHNRLFRRVNSDVVRNAYEVRRTFDRIVRESSIKRHDPDEIGNSDPTNEICVYYYSNPQNPLLTAPDRYAWFYLDDADDEDDTELVLAQGPVVFDALPPPEPVMPPLNPPISRIIVAHNVVVTETGIFSVQGQSVRMVLMLDNESNSDRNRLETLKMTVTTTAIRHNQ